MNEKPLETTASPEIVPSKTYDKSKPKKAPNGRLSEGYKFYLLELLKKGISYRNIARDEGVNVSTLQEIARNRELGRISKTDIIEATKKSIVGRLYVLCDKILENFDVSKMALAQKAVVFGIFLDKARLLSNESTENVAVHTVVGDIDREVANIRAERVKIAREIAAASEVPA